MRCPKCHYISFGSADRCRNCGYEFSLSADPVALPLDLPIQADEQPVGPMRDLQLGGQPAAAPIADEPVAARRAAASRLDLPLFSDRGSAAVDDAPLISAPVAPRPPLSVRRAPPVAPKPQADRLPSDAEDSATIRDPRRMLRAGAAESTPAARTEDLVVASIPARFLAGLIDVLILLAIDATVLYFTLRVVELPVAEVRSLPPVPLAVFLLLLNGGYLSAFTAAGGQTIGKMAARIRVVALPPEDDEGFEHFSRRVTLGAAVLRAAAYLASLLPAGLGFAAILLDSEGRALHDRLAETRVVKA
jgi:uncharacterized RDD family membrane protein YckC